jgi:hypothetical protein
MAALQVYPIMKRTLSEESTLCRRRICEGEYVFLDAGEAGWSCGENSGATPHLPLGAVPCFVGCAIMQFRTEWNNKSSGLPDVLYQLSS